MMEVDAVGERAARLESALANLLGRLDAAATLAVEEVASARGEIRAVAATAERHGAELTTVAAQLRADPSGSKRGVGQALVALSATTTAFLAKNRERLADARRATRASLRYVGEVREVSARVNEVTFEAALVALNAQIASAKIGDLGAAASVISSRMRTLAREIAASNDALGAIAGDIADALPTIDEAVAGAEAQATAYVRDAEVLRAKVEGAFDALRSDVEGVSASGRARAGLVGRELADVLRHLDAHEAVDRLLARVAEHAAQLEGRHDRGGVSATELRAWCDTTVGLVARTSELSVAHIGPIVAAMSRLNEGARLHVVELEEVCARLAPTAGGGPEQDAHLDELVRALGRFVEFVGDSTRVQSATIAAARGRARALEELLEQTHGYALEAAVIGITTKIESARLAAHGADFLNIGARMEELNQAIRAALDRGLRLARAIAGSLGEMHRAFADNERSVAAFARAQSSSLEEYRRASERATTDAREAVTKSRERASAMLQHCFQAIVHFQFQDRLTQELGSIERLVEAIARYGACDDSSTREVASQQIDAIPSFVVTGQAAPGAEVLGSGEVMMF